MATIISTEISGFHEIRGTYNEEAKTVTFETFINLSIGKSIKIGEVTLTKQEIFMMLKYFYDAEDRCAL
ncbi:hypothetical protein R6U77_09995 [Lysinibacillus louembei]|uniref:Uncharacterized protein n=1 Tax=Lysinibacillus louembei TaxID=1470088 RepID=A0ABZ0RSN3_9BACI|nr:hypothetical protein [Lysinibacillus louembei]WPK10267.1 hypothetical protein R6U77_09995 [Lysinibacillus louembei]